MLDLSAPAPGEIIGKIGFRNLQSPPEPVGDQAVPFDLVPNKIDGGTKNVTHFDQRMKFRHYPYMPTLSEFRVNPRRAGKTLDRRNCGDPAKE
jgi:hypothetical protein